MKSNDATTGEDYLLMWMKVKCRTIRLWMLVRPQLNIAAIRLTKTIEGD
jgi:hypothetical protein